MNQAQPSQPTQPAPSAPNSSLKWLLVVLAIVVLGGGGYYYYSNYVVKSATTSASPSPTLIAKKSPTTTSNNSTGQTSSNGNDGQTRDGGTTSEPAAALTSTPTPQSTVMPNFPPPAGWKADIASYRTVAPQSQQIAVSFSLYIKEGWASTSQWQWVDFYDQDNKYQFSISPGAGANAWQIGPIYSKDISGSSLSLYIYSMASTSGNGLSQNSEEIKIVKQSLEQK